MKNGVNKLRERIRENRAKRISEALKKGERRLEVLCQIGGDFISEEFCIFCYEYDIVLPEDLQEWRQRPKIDQAAKEGLSLYHIGELVGLTRDKVMIYLKETQQFEAYRELRQDKYDHL